MRDPMRGYTGRIGLEEFLKARDIMDAHRVRVQHVEEALIKALAVAEPSVLARIGQWATQHSLDGELWWRGIWERVEHHRAVADCDANE